MSTKVKAWLGVIGFVVIVGSCQNALGGDDQPTTTPEAAPAASSPYGSSGGNTAVQAAEADTDPSGEGITVARVIDGDTFELADGRTVRVLGIDSCEMKAPQTYGGEQAKSWAEGLLARYKTITMSAEPGAPDTDRYGRLLRYVQVDGEDFGTEMVKWDHTGVYQGDNDAAATYVQQLYAHDLDNASNPPSGRECADPYPAPASGGSIDIDNDDDHNSRDGSIIPACRHKWWC